MRDPADGQSALLDLGCCGPVAGQVAVAQSMLETAYGLMARGRRYGDLGADYFDRRDPEQMAARLADRIRRLGYPGSYSRLPQAA